MDIDMREVYKPKDIVILKREKADLLLLINKGDYATTYRMTIKDFKAEDTEELNIKLSPGDMTVLRMENSRVLCAMNVGGLLKVFWMKLEEEGGQGGGS
jgi:hypothetical protein